MKKIIIFQVRKEVSRDFGFMSYSSLKKVGGFDFCNYEKVYECKRPDDYTEDDAFDEFNLNHPEDFKGHSLSTGDLVAIGGKVLYCDSFGWKIVVEI